MADRKNEHRLFNTWAMMKRRCFDNKHTWYKNYGGRGITVCERWLNFWEFVKDMDNTYKKGLTLERINNDGNYELANCRWATRQEQALNSRNIERARRYVFKGLNLTIREWAEKLGVKRTTLGMRLTQYGWPVERALEGGY